MAKPCAALHCKRVIETTEMWMECAVPECGEPICYRCFQNRTCGLCHLYPRPDAAPGATHGFCEFCLDHRSTDCCAAHESTVERYMETRPKLVSGNKE